MSDVNKNNELENVKNQKTLTFTGVTYYHKCTNPNPDLCGKYYIGTTPDEKTRLQKWNYWKNPQYAGKKLQDARNRTAPEEWDYKVLETKEFSSKEEYMIWANKKEHEYIEKYDSFNDGFNGNRGGTGRDSASFTEEIRKQISEKSKNLRHTQAAKDKISMKNKNRKVSLETRIKISEGNKGKKRTPQQIAAQKARTKGIPPSPACNLAAKAWREKNGSWWSNHPISKEAIEKRSKTIRKSSQRIRVTYKDGKVTCYSCQTDAAKATGLKDGSVFSALKYSGGIHKKSGYKFEKITEVEYQEWLGKQ